MCKLNTVTITVDEYLELKEYQKAIENKKGVIIIKGYIGEDHKFIYPEAGVSSEIIKRNEELLEDISQLNEELSELKDENKELKIEMYEIKDSKKGFFNWPWR